MHSCHKQGTHQQDLRKKIESMRGRARLTVKGFVGVALDEERETRGSMAYPQAHVMLFKEGGPLGDGVLQARREGEGVMA